QDRRFIEGWLTKMGTVDVPKPGNLWLVYQLSPAPLSTPSRGEAGWRGLRPGLRGVQVLPAMAVRKAGATQLPGGAGLRARGGGHPPVAGGRLPAPDRRGRPLRQAAGGEAGGLRLCTAVLGRGPRPHPAGQALRLPGPSGRGELCHGGGPLRPGVRLPGAGAGHPLGEDGGGPAAGARPH
ncbi:unnamed protein product, partial [Heterosigma akashiwo]